MQLNTIKKSLQDHFSDGLVTIVGSGLSCAEGLPGMGELAEHLAMQLGSGLTAQDLELWNEIKALVIEKGLEAALLIKPPTETLEAEISAKTAMLIADRERKVVSDVFNGKVKLRLTRLIAHLLKPESGLPIVTTNYDRLVEIAVEEAGIGVDTMFVGRFVATLNERESKLSFCRGVTYKNRSCACRYQSRAIVFKPHGSLDWYIRDGQPVSYGGDLQEVNRLIITPGKNKFRNGYDSPFDLHRSKANGAIDRASRFLIIGYGFNDDHLETHLVAKIKEGAPTLMLAKILSNNATDLAMKYPNVTALESHSEGGVAGTLVTSNKSKNFFQIWKYGMFTNS